MMLESLQLCLSAVVKRAHAAIHSSLVRRGKKKICIFSFFVWKKKTYKLKKMPKFSAANFKHDVCIFPEGKIGQIIKMPQLPDKKWIVIAIKPTDIEQCPWCHNDADIHPHGIFLRKQCFHNEKSIVPKHNQSLCSVSYGRRAQGEIRVYSRCRRQCLPDTVSDDLLRYYTRVQTSKKKKIGKKIFR